MRCEQRKHREDVHVPVAAGHGEQFDYVSVQRHAVLSVWLSVGGGEAGEE